MGRKYQFIFTISLCFAVPVASQNPTYRLPGDLTPLTYNISLVTDLENSKFFGEVHIQFLCLNETSTVYLHSSSGLTIDNKITLEGGGLSCGLECVTNVSREVRYEYLIVKLLDQLESGQKYILKLAYSSELNQNEEGYYRSSYLDSVSNTKKWMASTIFETALARSAFPCFDEPSMKAKFRIRLGHRNTYTSVSNMPLAREVPMENRKGWVWSEFEESEPMSTYLVGWVVSQLEYRESTSPIGTVKFRVWARPDALNKTSLALSAAPKLLQFYEEFFEIKYPLPKLDFLAIPVFPSSAMENWGLITFRETNLLYDDSRPSVNTEEEILKTVAHEIAHQWFGNLVTMKWWTDVWLKEGFATYLGALAMNQVNPNGNSLDDASMNEMMNVLELDSLKSSHPISAPVRKASDADEMFDIISYEKGSIVIRMTHNVLGSSFRKGLTRYLRANQYSNADQDDLWAALTSQAHEDGILPDNVSVEEIMDAWVLQAGYPVLKVIRDYETGAVQVSQSKFYTNEEHWNERPCWWFPLTYTSRKEANFDSLIPKRWLKCGRGLLEISEPSISSNDWLIVNLKQSGLARVLYDLQNWDLLIQTLDSDRFESIHESNRGGLIDDVFTFADRGDLPYGTAVRLIRYLHRETRFIPLSRGMYSLDAVRRRLARTPNYGIFKNFMKRTLTPPFRRFNLSFTSNGNNNPGKMNALLTEHSCRYEVEDCMQQTKALYDKWLSENIPIPFDLEGAVLSNAVKHGGESTWNEIYHKFSKSDNPSEFKFVLSALACSPDERIIHRYLNWTLTEAYGIEKQDAGRVFSDVISCGPNGFDLALGYLENNLERIYQYHQPAVVNMVRYISSVGSHIIYPHELNRFQRLIRENDKFLDGIRMVVQQSLERAATNVDWHNKHYETVSNLLREI